MFLAARYRPSSQEDVERFGKMEIENRLSELVEILKHVEPRLKRLTTISEHGASMLYADIGVDRLLPVSLMGDGMARLLSLALGFVTARNGFILFDEIENGLHHSTMVNVWKSLAHFARTFNVQIFATTHSHECVRSAHQAFQEEGKYDFRLHRLDRVGDGIRAVTYDEEMLSTALESGLEVR